MSDEDGSPVRRGEDWVGKGVINALWQSTDTHTTGSP
jgi:hypothetical protein